MNASGDTIISRICPPNEGILEIVLDRLENVQGEKETKMVLIEGLKEIVCEVLTQVDKVKTVDILEWGLDPQFLEMENIQVSDFGDIVPLLLESLEGSRYYHEVENLTYHGTISKSMVVMNASEEDDNGNFEISSRDYLYAEQVAEQNNLTLPRVYYAHSGQATNSSV